MRIGFGTDTHRLQQSRRLVLGGVEVPYDKGLLGHSDADVLAHAIIDAILGAAGLGDIGTHFPDTDPAHKDADSMELLQQVMELAKGFRVVNVDATVVAQQPRLAGYIPEMRQKLAKRLGIPAERVNIKATTTEKLGFEGRGEGISAQAVCLLEEV